MRILAIGDEATDTLYNTNHDDLVEPVDVLLGCGDLPYTYMEHVVTALKVRDAFFVHGNHDSNQWLNDGTCLTAPGGWQDVDRRAARTTDKSMIVAGLQGSIRYRPRAAYQYSQTEMSARARRLVRRRRSRSRAWLIVASTRAKEPSRSTAWSWLAAS